MVIEINRIPGVKATINTVMRDVIAKGSNVLDARVKRHRAHMCLSTPLNENQGRVVGTSNLPLRCTKK